jgi:Asp/Glu/hydantoin racemase
MKYGVSEHVAPVITIAIPVLALEMQQKRTVCGPARAVQEAVRADGAQAIVLGCTGMSSLIIALKRRLARKRFAPSILEPLGAAVCTAVGWE